MVLVVIERPGEPFVDHFWLLTSVSEKRCDAHALLRKYRKRGKAEAHMGELMDVLRPALSSVSRPKRHYRGNPIAPRERSEGRCRASPQRGVVFCSTCWRIRYCIWGVV